MELCIPAVCFIIYLFILLLIIYRPTNKEELFNLRHSSARFAIEHLFRVLKNHFRILLLAPAEYDLHIQARIPAALCAIHNFICTHDLDESDKCQHGYYPKTATDQPNSDTAGEDEECERRDQIAQEMWEDYQRMCTERGIDEEDPALDDDYYYDEFDPIAGEEL
jgi:hypothetical protein